MVQMFGWLRADTVRTSKKKSIERGLIPQHFRRQEFEGAAVGQR